MSNRSFRGIRVIRFNDFELDVKAFELRRQGARVRLQEQPLRILTALLERPGEVVARDEIRKRLWPNDTAVEVSHGINAAVQRLREALGESAENPRYIETMARRGYRFIAPVEITLRTPSDTPAEADAGETPPPEAVSHFRVLDRLGIGGMGVVYRAEDQKLGRQVALKFLPLGLAADPAALARFRREAQAASALNHPNICTIYGVEECDGRPVIVMELIEGESLEAVLARGALPVDEAVAIAIQIVAALDAAHRKGIVHRDLKPANVLVTATIVKVLDFGLAKMERPLLGMEGPSYVTQEGAILGTLHYMSPEHAEGKHADASSDIFSFGALLYEMLAGRRAFDGPNAARVMAAILTQEPAPLDSAIPRPLDLVLRRCLAKEPEERWQSARDLKAALEWLSFPRERQSAALKPPKPKETSRRWLVVLAAALFLTAGAWYLTRRDKPPPLPVAVPTGKAAPVAVSRKLEDFPTAPPAGRQPRKGVAIPLAIPPAEPSRTLALPTGDGAVTRLSLSPDGKRMAYISLGRLWIAGTDGTAPVMYDEANGIPFWSPDGRYVAAAAGRTLRRFEPGTQNTAAICSVNTTLSGAWAPDGTIIIGLQQDGIYRVPATGGALQRITNLDASRGESRHLAPEFLPDGRHFLYVAGSMQAGRSMLYIASLDSPERTPIMLTSSNVYFAPLPERLTKGYLVYAEGSLLAARPFDWKTHALGQEPFRLGESVTLTGSLNALVSMADFSVARNLLAFHAMRPTAVMLIQNWMSRLR
jgi:serine/threonine protein kinase